MRKWLPAVAFDRPVTVFMAVLALLALGILSWARIPVQMWPSGFDPSFLWIWVPYPNSSPRETDEAVVRVIEEQLSTVTGIKTLESGAESGSAWFQVEFHGSQDMGTAYNAVVDRMERALVDLPEDVGDYGVFKFNPDDQPVMWLGVSMPEGVDAHYVLTRVMQPRLERMPGVASIDVWGVGERRVYVDYDLERFMAHGVDLGELQGRLGADNLQMAGGRIEERGLLRYVRSLALLSDIDTLRDYPVRDDLVLADIADVRMRSVRESSFNRINGEDGASFAIKKESSANTAEVCRRVEAALAELEQDPRMEGVRFFTFFSQGDLIRESMDNLFNTLLMGGVLAVIVLFAFLREWRMTLLIALSIPLSLLITIGVLYFRGDSLNLLALMGLMLAVGMVVDNAIVVIEAIYRRRAEGMGLRAATVEGAAEVNLAILLSTATTMVVFLPIILMSENATFSFFMKVLGLPVVFALGASLLVALVFAPFATRFVRHAQVREDPRWLQWLTDRYERMLAWVLAHRADSAAALVAMLLVTVAVPMQQVGCTDAGDGNLNDFTIRFSVPREASIQDRDTIVQQVEEVVEANRERWGVRVYRSRLESDSYWGQLYVYLETDAPMSREDVMEDARKALPNDIPGVRTRVGWDDGGTGRPTNQLTVMINGEDMEVLDALSDEVIRVTEQLPGVIGSRKGYEVAGTDEIRLRVDRDALAHHRMDAMTVAQTVAWAMRGTRLEDMRQGEREVPVLTGLAVEDRGSIDVLGNFPVWSGQSGTQVPLRALTDVEVGKGPAMIRRINRRTGVKISIDLDKETTTEEMQDVVFPALQLLDLPRGYTIGPGLEREFQLEEDEAQQFALLLSVTFVFLLMGILLESFVLPLSIITTVPMAMMGALWGLWITDTPMDSMAAVGLVILVGVVVNNGIVLVDLVTQLRREGMERTEALLVAGRRRLRPILMTALTTIGGLIPMAVGSAAFIGIPYAPLGRIVIAGLATATVLTLIFVPFLYAVLDDLREAMWRWYTFVRSGALTPAGGT